jgi:OOP family OmpA-OmpF porin
MSSVLRNTLASFAVAAMLLPVAASAQDAKNQGYLTDTRTAIVHAPVAGVCVRTSDWTPARAVAECDPDLVKKPAPKMMKKAAPKKAAKAKPKPKPKKKKVKMVNVAQKIELQGIAFNRTEMTADNKKELNKFLAGLGKANKKAKRGPVKIGAVVVTGHTDRIGSDKYNMKLSERRAVVVKDYLVSKGVDKKLIFWEGKGEKQPIPVTKFCDNKMKRKELIQCLSPNRRVTVEVVGRAVPTAKPKAKAKKPARKR